MKHDDAEGCFRNEDGIDFIQIISGTAKRLLDLQQYTQKK